MNIPPMPSPRLDWSWGAPFDRPPATTIFWTFGNEPLLAVQPRIDPKRILDQIRAAETRKMQGELHAAAIRNLRLEHVEELELSHKMYMHVSVNLVIAREEAKSLRFTRAILAVAFVSSLVFAVAASVSHFL